LLKAIQHFKAAVGDTWKNLLQLHGMQEYNAKQAHVQTTNCVVDAKEVCDITQNMKYHSEEPSHTLHFTLVEPQLSAEYQRLSLLNLFSALSSIFQCFVRIIFQMNYQRYKAVKSL
jgi:hypothetical protein